MYLLHPGGGMYDCLSIRSCTDGRAGAIDLNRNGRIHINARFDGDEVQWEPVEWVDYLRADPYRFLRTLEDGAGLPAPSSVPAATPMTLTLRVLAALTATTVKQPDPILLVSGFHDTAEQGGGGPNDWAFDVFPGTHPRRAPRDGDPAGIGEYRFWFAERAAGPILAFEQREGLAWTRDSGDPLDLMAMYVDSGRNATVVASALLRRAEASS